MGKRKITILEPAVEAVAKIALYIEGQGLPETANDSLTRLLHFLRDYPMTGSSIAPVSIYPGSD